VTCFSVSRGEMVRGMHVAPSKDRIVLGSRPGVERVVRFYPGNPPWVDREGNVFDIHPVQVGEEVFLAKPFSSQRNGTALVLVRTQGLPAFRNSNLMRAEGNATILAQGFGLRTGKVEEWWTLIVFHRGDTVLVRGQRGRSTVTWMLEWLPSGNKPVCRPQSQV